MNFLLILLLPTVVAALPVDHVSVATPQLDSVSAARNEIIFYSEADFMTSSLQARTGMPIFTTKDFNWYPVCGDMSLDTAHWICRKQGHTRGALSVMKNSAAPGRSGVTKAMISTMNMFTSYITNLDCGKDATWLDNGCTYTQQATCQFGDETIVECDTGKITQFPATSMVAGYGNSSQTQPSKQGTIVVQMGDFDQRTGDFTRMTLGYFCAADVRNQATADKICKLLDFVDATRAVEWKRAGDVTEPKMRLTRSAMDSVALRAIKMGSCETVETCGLEEDWNLCGPEDSLSIKCE
eukprot:sb/3467495/